MAAAHCQCPAVEPRRAARATAALGRWPEAPLLHVAVLAAYGLAGFLVALRLFRRRLSR
jgi:hypothetical protein